MFSSNSNGLGFSCSSPAHGSFLGLGQGTDLFTNLVKSSSPFLYLSLGPGLGLGLGPVLDHDQGCSLDLVLGPCLGPVYGPG